MWAGGVFNGEDDLHPDLQASARQAGQWLRRLFGWLCAAEAMPSYYRRLIETEGLERMVCDYIAHDRPFALIGLRPCSGN